MRRPWHSRRRSRTSGASSRHRRRRSDCGIAAQIHAANARIDEFEAKAKPRRAQAELAAIEGLKVAKQDIERMLVDLKATRDAQVARAKVDMDAAIVAFQASLEDFRRTYTTPSEKK